MQIQKTATVANGASLSGIVTLGQPIGTAFYGVGSFYPVDVSFDSAWDTQSLTFQAAGNDGVFFNVMDVDTESEYVLTACAASTKRQLKWENFKGACYIKARSGTAASAQNQSGDSVLTFDLNNFD